MRSCTWWVGQGALVAASLLALLALAPAAGAQSQPHPTPPLAEPPADALGEALDSGALSEAEYALHRARSLFRIGAVRAQFGNVARPPRHDATLVLRDLALRLADLSAPQRRAARALLARPTDPAAVDPDAYSVASSSDCGAATDNICVHWVSTTSDAATPEWTATTKAVFEDVWRQEVDVFGYRAPLEDSDSPNQGPDARFDVYLANLADDGLFGYCATDDPDMARADVGGPYDVSAYCVVDNDYVEGEVFGTLSPLQALAVTAAHEFFHAVQFAYDWTEDVWFLESLATWMEDELEDSAAVPGLSYDSVNDNVNFLATSPLSNPGVPLDKGSVLAPADTFRYGAWIFWRFLSEQLLGRSAVRAVLTRADGSAAALAAGRDEHSTKALVNSLRLGRPSVSFRLAFARFARTNRMARYAEGRALNFPVPRARRRQAVGLRRPTTGWRSTRLKHLSNRFFAFRPGPHARRTSRLRLEVDLPTKARGSAASVIVNYWNGRRTVRRPDLDRNGRAATSVPFGRGRVRSVDLVLTNASVRIYPATCWSSETPFSCGGAVPRDDNLRFHYRADLR